MGGQVSARAAERLHRLSVGSPLVLRELIRVALANDSLREHRGVWQLDGALPADAQLAELVSLRLSALDDGRREALELVALSEPLDFDTLLRLSGGPASSGWSNKAWSPSRAHDRGRAGRPERRCGSRIRCTASGCSPRCPRAVDEGWPGSSSRPSRPTSLEHAPADPLRIALLRVQAGLATDPMALMAAGRAAMRHDAAAAHTLLRAAVTAGGGVPARLALAESLALSYPEQTRALLAELAAEPLPDELAMAVMALSALVTTMDGDDPSARWRRRRRAARAAADPVSGGMAHLLGGDAGQAIALAEPWRPTRECPGLLVGEPQCARLRGWRRRVSWTPRSSCLIARSPNSATSLTAAGSMSPRCCRQ